jgi:hypothetical protein
MDAPPEAVRRGLGEPGKEDEKERVRETKKEDGKKETKKRGKKSEGEPEQNQEENRRTEKEKLNHWEFFWPFGGQIQSRNASLHATRAPNLGQGKARSRAPGAGFKARL